MSKWIPYISHIYDRFRMGVWLIIQLVFFTRKYFVCTNSFFTHFYGDKPPGFFSSILYNKYVCLFYMHSSYSTVHFIDLYIQCALVYNPILTGLTIWLTICILKGILTRVWLTIQEIQVWQGFWLGIRRV